MALVRLDFEPGIKRDRTRHSAGFTYWDCDLVRFLQGKPQTIGGWTKLSSTAMLGVARDMLQWRSLTGSRLLGVGTHLKYYIFQGTTPYDVTPIRSTTAAGEITFSASNGSSTITVTDTNHGAIDGDFVTFSGAASLGGNITAAVLNQEYQLTYVNANSYTITATATANASDTGNGGASVVGAYQINVGRDTTVAALGFGSGPFGAGFFGRGGGTTPQLLSARVWSSDTFGEDLVHCVREGGIYYWDFTSGTSARSVALSSLSGANGAPTVVGSLLVSDQDRHCIVFGSDPFDDVGVYNPLLIRWCDRENIAEWIDSTTNTAGSWLLSSGNEIVAAVQTKQQIVILTDTSVYGMQFVGAPYTFAIAPLSEGTTIIGPKALTVVADIVMWMGTETFWIYDGVTRELECPVKSYIFDRLNRTQALKVYAGRNTAHNEVWWFYASENSDNVDSYVVYNYAQNIWYYGSLARTCWSDAGVWGYPMACDQSGYVYYHEFGMNDGSQNPAVGINAYIESAPFEIGEGDEFAFIHRIIPDMTFRDSTGSPTATMTLKARRYPGSGVGQTDSGSVTQTSAVVEAFTERLDVRIRGREFQMKVESNSENVEWRLGTPRVDVEMDGME